MKNIYWHYPDSIEKALDLMRNNQAVPHGGGTHLTGKRLKNENGFVSLDKLDLKYVRKEGNTIKIGSLADYNTVAERLEKIEPGHILTKSIGKAATSPLRNRITIGGSLRLAPNWSDLTGPLVALDAQVKLEGDASGTFPVTDYLSKKELKSNTLITEVILPASSWQSWYYREGITENDHPAFTITILAKHDGNSLEDIRIVITGHTKRFAKATAIEDQLKGKELKQLELDGIAKDLTLKFAPAKGMSSEYIKHLTQTQLERGLTELLKS
ncbi:MAG: FAD binding domain-containing protein [Bacteroidales bacterium]|nr:FAD binding domain-containing protein [Bacteroidales bacterium]